MKYLTYIRTITVTFILTAATFLPTVAQTTRRVTEGGIGDGSTWATSSSLQAALTASNMTGDQIWIAAGTYKPHPTDKTVTFSIPAGVLVYGGFDGTEDALADRAGGPTILSGDLSDNDPARGEADYDAMRTDNSKTVVTIAGANTTLDGLTIKGGEEGTSFDEFRSDGAGLFASTGTAGIVLRNCSFTNNNVEHSSSSFGGGAYFAESATLTNCTFIDNTATSDGGGAYFNVDATLTNCVFASNTANRGGGAWLRSGGTVINSTFYNNTATVRGGGLFLVFEDTDMRTDGLQTSPFTLQNSILVGNTATTAGPQVYVNNTATSEVNIQTNLIEGGAADIVYATPGGDIMEAGTVDATAAAVFASTDADNAEYLRLKAGGPAVNAGNNTYASGITTDAAGRARIQDGTVDLGAYESGIKTAQQIIFNAPADNVIGAVGDVITLGAQSQTLAASATELFVSFAIDPSGLATLTDNGDGTGTIHLDAPGTVVITASQGGGLSPDGETYDPATDVTRTITVRPAAPTIFRVTETGAGTKSGSEWENATTLQAALTASTVTGDQLWIKAGTYTPGTVLDSNNPTDEERAATFTIPEGVKLYGGFAGTETTFDPTTTTGDTRPRNGEGVLTSVTTLSGDLLGGDLARPEAGDMTAYNDSRADNSYTVVTVGDANATLDGLTITAGEGGTPLFTGRIITERRGAGLFAPAGTTGLKLINCIFSGNNITSTVVTDFLGGAAFFSHEATVRDCIFIDNTAVFGGAVYVKDSQADVKFKNCTFMDNMAVSGGAVYERSSNGGTFENCLFANNRATTGNGGGIQVQSPSSLTNTVFYNNTANNRGGGAYFPNGGTVINSTFYNNRANNQGGGIYFRTSAAIPCILRNSLLIGNTATNNASGHQVYVNNTTATNEVNLQNNLIAGGADPMGTDQGAVYANTGAGGLMQANTVDASDVATVFASTDAMNADFLRLAVGSPAIDAGDDEYLNNGTPANTDDDITTDAAGRPRILGGTVDLGAYESKVAQTIDFTLVASGTVGTEITLSATSSAGLPVTTYTSSAPAVAEVVDVAGTPTLRLLTLGTATITASNGGNDTYAAADVTQDITIRAPGVFRVTEGGDMAADGSAWATATTLNNALGMAVVGDQVWIAAGEYKPGTVLDSDAPTDEERTATFTIPAGVLVYGGFAGTEATFDPTTDDDTRPRDGEGVLTSVTTLSGDLLGGDLARPETGDMTAYNDSRADNSNVVVTVTEANVVLDGLTITAGEGTNGAGLSSTGANTAVTNCTFTNNTGEFGGGAFFNNAATLTGCTFTGNTATTHGGGAYFRETATIGSNTFMGNTATVNGGGAFFRKTATLTGSTFMGNTATINGGGAFFNLAVRLTNGVFAGNTATESGGGLYLADGGTFINTTLYDNTATNSNGGGIYVAYNSGVDFNLRNSLLLGNSAMDDASGHQLYVNNTDAAYVVSLQHNLLAGGAAGIVYATAGAMGISEANTVDATDAGTVFASIVASENNYLRLKDGSPAIGAGNNDYVDNAVPPITTDAAGAMRIQIGTVDLGAYESTFQATQTIDFTLAAAGTVGNDIALTATSSAGLAVSYASSELAIAEVVDNNGTPTLRLMAAGTTIITASQSGDGTYKAATDVVQTITVRAPVIRRVIMAGDAAADGDTWATAMTLKAALASMLLPDDQVWIAAGTYKPDGTDRAATFRIPAGVLVYGGFNPATDNAIDSRTGAATILSGDLLGDDIARPAATADQATYDANRDDNSNVVVTIAGADVTLDGLTITAGEGGNPVAFNQGAGLYVEAGTTAITLMACTFTNNASRGRGSGAYFREAATLTDCTFTNNVTSNRGGGAFFGGVATLTNCTFTGNEAFDGGGARFFGVATLTDCTFTDNEATNGVGGGAFFNVDGTLMACTFTDNEAATHGGGARFFGVATLTNCVFASNTVTIGTGGGISLNAGSTIINSTLYNNTTGGQGGGIRVEFSVNNPFILRNSILVGNTARDAATGHQVRVSNTDAADVATLQNNLIEGGADPLGTDQGVVYTTPGGSITQTGTVDAAAAAVFASTTANEANYLRLKDGSPAISAGNNDYLNNGTPGNTDDDVTTDAAGAVRIQGGTVDLGAYESDTKLAQTIMFTLATTGTVNDKIDLTATAGAGLEVTFASSDEAVAAIGTGVDAGKLVLKTEGTAIITASQSGDDTYAAAMDVTQTIMVEAAGNQAQVITFMLATTGVVGEKPALSATSDSGLEVSYASSDETVASIGTGTDAGKLVLKAAGTAIITASQAGSPTYAAATPVTQMITVEATGSQAQAITFTLVGTGTAGDKIALDAMADSGLEVSYASSDETVASIGMGTDAGKLVLEAAGTAIITASQAGSTTYAPAIAVMQTIMVEAAGDQPQMIAFTLAGTGTAGDKIDLTAMADSNLPVRYASSDEAVAAIGTGADAGKLVLKTEGTAIITASQPGNPTYAPAPPVTQTIMVSKQAQTIAFTLAATGMVNDKIALTATAESGLEVTFASSDEAVAAIGTGADAGMLVLKTAGTAIITASQSGDDAYEAAPPVTQMITVDAVLGLEETADGFGLYPNPTSGKLHFSEQVAEFRLYGIEGRLLETGKNVRSVDITARPAGLYFVEVVRGERSLRWRVVRE